MLRQAAGLMMGLFIAFAAVAAPTPPEKIIQSATDELRDKIKQNVDTYRKDKVGFYAEVDKTLVPHFDTPYVAQLVLGRNWRTASPEQRQHFEAAFKNMLVHGYADNLLDYYDSVRIDVKPARVDQHQNANVDTLLYRPKVQQPTAISFKLRQVDNEWKVFDVIVENISLVLNFRTQVDAEIKRTSLNDVIARMDKGEVFKANTQNGQGGQNPPKSAGSAG